MVPATLPYSGGHLLVPAALLSCPQLGNSTVVVMLNNILLMFLGPCTYTEQYCLHISCLQLPSGPVSTVINTPQWNPGGATRGGAWALGTGQPSNNPLILLYCTYCKEVWWSSGQSPCSRSHVPGSKLGPAGPPHSMV